MKFFTTFFCVVCCALKIIAQQNDYSELDKSAINIPAEQTTTTTADIASYINTYFHTDSKKVRAIYCWVAGNIKYDKTSIHPVILNEDREQKIIVALKTRRGVCENFAAIFNDICAKSGLKSFVVEGFTKQHGVMDRSPHAWCTVLIDNQWALYDPTWDAGFINSSSIGEIADDYFQPSPAVFIQSHMPFDPMFQMINYPVTYKEFYNGNTQVNNRKPYFNYADSIAAYEKMNSLNQYLTAASRIERNGTPTSMINNKLNQLKMEIEIIFQDKDKDMYNSAVADYNDALSIFNTFINYRNNQFKPLKTESDIQTLFDGVEKKIMLANTKLNEVSRSKATLILDTSVIEQKLSALSSHVKEQQAFLKNYISTAKEK